MKRIPSDAEAPELAQWEDGEFKVDSFEWFSVDDNENPCLVQQKNGLVGRLRFIVVGQEDGPPFSVFLSDMSLLVLAFGGSIADLPARPDYNKPTAISKYMRKVAELCNSAGKEITVTVKGGWANKVEGMEIPGGVFYFYLSDISPRDEKSQLPTVTISDPKWGPFFFAEFTIVAGEGPAPSPYDGCSFAELYNYGLIVGDDGRPDWKVTKSGELSADAIHMGHLMDYSAPQIFEQESYAFGNAECVLPEWLDEALSDRKILKGYRAALTSGKRKGEIHLSKATLEPAQGFQMAGVSIAAEAAGPNQGDALDLFRQFFMAIVVDESKGPAFEGESGWKLTDEGKVAAKKYLGPIVKKLSTRKLAEFTPTDVDTAMTAILPEISGEYAGSYQERLDTLFGRNDDDDGDWGNGDSDEDEIPF